MKANKTARETATEPRIVEIVYTWPDGREEVRYRRVIGTDDAKRFMADVDAIRAKYPDSCYSYRFV